MDLKRLGIIRPGIYIIAREYGVIKGLQDVTDWTADQVAAACDCIIDFGRKPELKRITEV